MNVFENNIPINFLFLIWQNLMHQPTLIGSGFESTPFKGYHENFID